MRRRAYTITETLALLAIATVLLSIAIPALARVRSGSGVAGSTSNLMQFGVAHVLYAADWEGRQVTWAVDDLGAYGSVADYNTINGCGIAIDPDCHPSIVAGWGNGAIWGYWMTNSAYHIMVEPIQFTGGAVGFGSYRLVNNRPIHQYLGGRYYDPVYYAPNDTVPLDSVAPCFNASDEFNVACNPPPWSSYSMSPAAMFHPDVMRSNAEGGWQDPWSLVQGFQSPGLFQATYPSLKTLMIEQHWVQQPPAECNDGMLGVFWTTYECEPYHFNQGIDSSPVSLFYDLSVRQLPNVEALASDQAVLKQTGEIDGLWLRSTPFGENGFYIDAGFDGAPLSHHILTTDGILGRDTLGDQMPLAAWGGAPADKPVSRRTHSLNAGPNPALLLEIQP